MLQKFLPSTAINNQRDRERHMRDRVQRLSVPSGFILFTLAPLPYQLLRYLLIKTHIFIFQRLILIYIITAELFLFIYFNVLRKEL